MSKVGISHSKLTIGNEGMHLIYVRSLIVILILDSIRTSRPHMLEDKFEMSLLYTGAKLFSHFIHLVCFLNNSYKYHLVTRGDPFHQTQKFNSHWSHKIVPLEFFWRNSCRDQTTSIHPSGTPTRIRGRIGNRFTLACRTTEQSLDQGCMPMHRHKLIPGTEKEITQNRACPKKQTIH